MATPVMMPKQGQSVETCLILAWKKQPGDAVSVGDILCEVETDKATFEVPAEAAGTLLAHFAAAGDDVPVLTNIAAIGAPGEDVSALRGGGAPAPAAAPAATAAPATATSVAAPAAAAPAPAPAAPAGPVAISPRARALADAKGVPVAALAGKGTGPEGRVIERDVEAYLASAPALTSGAKAALAPGQALPAHGTGVGGRVTVADLAAPAPSGVASSTSAATPAAPDATTVIPVKGIRKLIGDRMLQSLQTTAQLTLNRTADARALQAFRAKLKASPEEMGLQKVTINDLVLLAVARTLPAFPELNATFDGKAITQYASVHLAMAVDTPRGLMVPVIRHAQALSLKALAGETKRVANGCLKGGINPDELAGGTFTVTNLGAFGIESFTPVLNLPQVAILGVAGISLKPVQGANGVEFHPHLGLSLTINHMVVDGGPGARFLAALAENLAHLDLLLAL